MRRTLLPGQSRLHFTKEGARRRRELASALRELDLDVTMFVARATQGRSSAELRERCLTQIVRHLQDEDSAVSLILESRHHQDADDLPVIASARRRQPPLSYEHVDGDHDPLLWLPDAFAWLWGAGGEWQRRIAPAIGRTIDVS